MNSVKGRETQGLLICVMWCSGGCGVYLGQTLGHLKKLAQTDTDRSEVVVSVESGVGITNLYHVM